MSKYDGHTPGPWEAPDEGYSAADSALIADAPALLQAGQELAEALVDMLNYAKDVHGDEAPDYRAALAAWDKLVKDPP